MLQQKKVFDLIGIGIGPFNLGLAALCQEVPGFSCLFMDQRELFNWHPGVMLPDSRLQVPFYADLVTLADPCSEFSYLNYLHEQERMFRFALSENYYIKRTEYNDYCKWVVRKLKSLKFNTSCQTIRKERGVYQIETNYGSYFTKHIVVGIGTVPYIPEALHLNAENVFHSAEYLFYKERLNNLSSVTIIGSGQSGAEIFYDLLTSYEGHLNWCSRSSRLYPMDNSKFSLELSTPAYIDYFYQLPDSIKIKVLSSQDCLYKGINPSLISQIYELLSEKEADHIHIYPNCELQKIDENLMLHFFHTEMLQRFDLKTEAVIFATGYTSIFPACMDQLKPEINMENGNFKANRNYSIDEAHTIFVQNAEQATHGFNASDLSLGPYRNAVILNTILKTDIFKVEQGKTFQRFGSSL
jgi:lysine N6-hydroxylase